MAKYDFSKIIDISETNSEEELNKEWDFKRKTRQNKNDSVKCICSHLIFAEINIYKNNKNSKCIFVGSGCKKTLKLDRIVVGKKYIRINKMIKKYKIKECIYEKIENIDEYLEKVINKIYKIFTEELENNKCSLEKLSDLKIEIDEIFRNNKKYSDIMGIVDMHINSIKKQIEDDKQKERDVYYNGVKIIFNKLEKTCESNITKKYNNAYKLYNEYKTYKTYKYSDFDDKITNIIGEILKIELEINKNCLFTLKDIETIIICIFGKYSDNFRLVENYIKNHNHNHNKTNKIKTKNNKIDSLVNNIINETKITLPSTKINIINNINEYKKHYIKYIEINQNIDIDVYLSLIKRIINNNIVCISKYFDNFKEEKIWEKIKDIICLSEM